MNGEDIRAVVTQSKNLEVQWVSSARTPGAAKPDLDVEEQFYACGKGLDVWPTWVVLDNTEGLLSPAPFGRTVHGWSDAECSTYAGRVAEVLEGLRDPTIQVSELDPEGSHLRLWPGSAFDQDVPVVWAFPGQDTDEQALRRRVEALVPLTDPLPLRIAATFGFYGGGQWEPSVPLITKFLERAVTLSCLSRFHVLERGLLAATAEGTVGVFAEWGVLVLVPPRGWDSPSPVARLGPLAEAVPYLAIASLGSIERRGIDTTFFQSHHHSAPLGDVRKIVRDPETQRSEVADLHVVGDKHEQAFSRREWRRRQPIAPGKYLLGV